MIRCYFYHKTLGPFNAHVLSKKLFLFSIYAVIHLKTKPLFVWGCFSAQMCAGRPELTSPLFPILAQKPGSFETRSSFTWLVLA